MNEYYLIILSMILVGGIACQLLAWRSGIPAIIFLLFAGFLAGPITGVFNPDTMFGDMLFPIVSLGVAVILFEGALTLKFSELSKDRHVIWLLVSIGALITMTIGAYAAMYMVGVPFPIALLFGAIVTVTGPTVIIPILRSVRPKPDIANILRWEGIIIDPLGVFLAILVFEYIRLDNTHDLIVVFATLCASGLLVGTVSAWVVAFVLKKHLVPDYLSKISVLAMVVGAFTLCDLIQPESGLLAVTIMGMILANTKGILIEELLDFKESLSILIISGLFIMLAARVDPVVLDRIGWGSLGVLLVLMLVARPLNVFISTLGSQMNWREKAVISWIAPRGIIAAAVAPFLALKLETAGVAGVEYLYPMVLVVIVGTVTIYSLSAGYVARILGVAEPEPRGVLIVGAGFLARKIGKALHDNGFPVIMADTNWDYISEARMLGLRTFFGNVVSEHADRHLNLLGIGKMMAISNRPSLNALAALRYRREFGTKNVFIIKTEEERRAREKDSISNEYTAPFLFGPDITQSQLTAFLSSGYVIRATTLSENFGFDDFLNKNKDEALPLFAINKKGLLRPFVEDTTLKPEIGWTILSLLKEQEATQKLEKNGKKKKAAA